jgi:hypothetical protein
LPRSVFSTKASVSSGRSVSSAAWLISVFRLAASLRYIRRPSILDKREPDMVISPPKAHQAILRYFSGMIISSGLKRSLRDLVSQSAATPLPFVKYVKRFSATLCAVDFIPFLEMFRALPPAFRASSQVPRPCADHSCRRQPGQGKPICIAFTIKVKSHPSVQDAPGPGGSRTLPKFGHDAGNHCRVNAL